jgi:fermentation-respiration switch protein FrsA (DUF1100 family)
VCRFERRNRTLDQLHKSHIGRCTDTVTGSKGLKTKVTAAISYYAQHLTAANVKSALDIIVTGGVCTARQLLPCHKRTSSRRQPRLCTRTGGSRLQRPLAMQHGWGPASVPISLMSDSYKASHYLQYPGTTKMVAVRSTYT